MRIEVDVLRAEQSWELDSGKQQNYLVIDVLGCEVRVPCSEEELTQAIRSLHRPAAAPVYEPEEAPVAGAGGLFQQAEEPAATPVLGMALAEAPARRQPVISRQPVANPAPREAADDAGIGQG